MKRNLILLFAFVVLMAVPLAAAQADTGPSIEPATMEAILILIAGGIVTTLTGLLKSVLKLTGTGAVVLTGAVAVAVTAVYFLFFNPPFEVLKFLLYAAAAFGEATGYYHIYKRA